MPSMYYCHHCDRNVSLRNSDLVCASCGSDFIEELTVPFLPGITTPGNIRASPFAGIRVPPRNSQSPRSRSVPPGAANIEPPQNENADNRRTDNSNFFQPFLNLINSFRPGQADPPAGDQPRSTEPRRMPHIHMRVERPEGVNGENAPNPQQFFQDLAERLGGAAGGNISVQIRIDGQRAPTLEIGDYAMGMDMDQILNNLMNQFGDGQPVQNLTEEQLQSIPIVKVEQAHIDNKTQCSTCFEDFVLDENVARLNCTHIFHVDCVKPWLRTHNTCPMCRTEVDARQWSREATQENRSLPDEAIPPPPAAPPGMIDADELD